MWLPPAGTLPLVGLAYNRCAESLIKKSPDSVDYLEIPFELLRHDASLIGLRRFKNR